MRLWLIIKSFFYKLPSDDNWLPAFYPNRRKIFSQIQSALAKKDYEAAALKLITVMQWCHKHRVHLAAGVNKGNMDILKLSASQGAKHYKKRVVELLIKRDGFHCAYCKVPMSYNISGNTRLPTIDHVMPKSKGGSNQLHNLVLACADCNSTKKDTLPNDLPTKRSL